MKTDAEIHHSVGLIRRLSCARVGIIVAFDLQDVSDISKLMTRKKIILLGLLRSFFFLLERIFLFKEKWERFEFNDSQREPSRTQSDHQHQWDSRAN
jgi:hypothetical protein